MRRFILGLTFLVMLMAILTHPLVSETVVAFFFLGIIPGTDTQLSFWTVVLLSLASIALLLKWLAAQPLYLGNLEQQGRVARQIARKHVVKKRYTTSRRSRKRPLAKRQFKIS